MIEQLIKKIISLLTTQINANNSKKPAANDANLATGLWFGFSFALFAADVLLLNVGLLSP